MFQPLSTLPLSKSTAKNAAAGGYVFIEDISDTRNDSDTFDYSGRFIDSEEIKNFARSPITLSALDHWQAELQYERFTTFSDVINDILDGGIQCGIITEMCGPSGSGKTQLCFQIAITVQLSSESGGLGGRSLYIDTRNAFSTQRIEDLITGCQKFCPHIELERNALAENITIISIATLEKLLLLVNKLRDYIQSSLKDLPIRLIIIDSFTFPMAPTNISSRKALYYQQILDELQKLASKHNIAVVIVHELITQVDIKGEIYFESAGGQAIASRCDRGLMLTRINNSKFAARLLKSPIMPQTAIIFEFATEGIRVEGNCN